MRLGFWRGVKSIRKTVEGVRKSRSNCAWKTFEALREVVRIMFAAYKFDECTTLNLVHH